MIAELDLGLMVLGALMMIGASILRRNNEASEFDKGILKALEIGGAALVASPITNLEYLRAAPVMHNMVIYYVILLIVGGTILSLWEMLLKGIEFLVQLR